MEYTRLKGHVITWNTGGSLRRFAEIAVIELGMSAQQTVALAAWMASFQLRPMLGGAVLAARVGDEAQDEPDSQTLRQADARGHEHALPCSAQLASNVTILNLVCIVRCDYNTSETPSLGFLHLSVIISVIVKTQ